MGNKHKSIKLRAFNIENNTLSQASSSLAKHLASKLPGTTGETRRMLLNPDDINQEEDFIGNWLVNKDGLVSGIMIRITHKVNIPNITNEILQLEQINLSQLDSLTTESNIIYKEHFYFLLDNNYIIANLHNNSQIKKLQIYLNWFLEDKREDDLYEITPVIVSQSEIKLSEISKIKVKDKVLSKVGNEPQTINKKISLALDTLKSMSIDTIDLDQLARNNIVSAEILIKFKKPKTMTESDYGQLLGHFLQSFCDDEDIEFETKKKEKIKGSNILKTKTVSIELTESSKINEPQLFQEMEKFIYELLKENIS